MCCVSDVFISLVSDGVMECAVFFRIILFMLSGPFALLVFNLVQRVFPLQKL